MHDDACIYPPCGTEVVISCDMIVGGCTEETYTKTELSLQIEQVAAADDRWCSLRLRHSLRKGEVQTAMSSNSMYSIFHQYVNLASKSDEATSTTSVSTSSTQTRSTFTSTATTSTATTSTATVSSATFTLTMSSTTTRTCWIDSAQVATPDFNPYTTYTYTTHMCAIDAPNGP